MTTGIHESFPKREKALLQVTAKDFETGFRRGAQTLSALEQSAQKVLKRKLKRAKQKKHQKRFTS